MLFLFLSYLTISHCTITVNYPSDAFTHPLIFQNYKVSFSKSLAKQTSYVDLSRAQDREDIWIYENWFYGMEHGVILESGALDGVKYSTSHMFEKFASWRPLHIEADPSNYAGLAQSRPDAVNVHSGLCDKPQTLHYTNTPRAAINGFVEFMSPPFLAQWHPRLVANPQLILSLPFVHCLPLSMILRHLKIKHIDVWILDIEGAEYFALQGVNWGAVSISTIVMESDFTNRTREVQKIDFLKSKGYICEMVERNAMCHHQSFSPSQINKKLAQFGAKREKDKREREERLSQKN